MLSFVVLAVYFFFATHSLSRPLFIPRCLVSCYFHLKWFQREDPLSSPDYIYPSAGPRGTRACVSRLAKGKRFSRHAKGRRKSTTPNRYIDPYILTRFQQKKWKKRRSNAVSDGRKWICAIWPVRVLVENRGADGLSDGGSNPFSTAAAQCCNQIHLEIFASSQRTLSYIHIGIKQIRLLDFLKQTQCGIRLWRHLKHFSINALTHGLQ